MTPEQLLTLGALETDLAAARTTLAAARSAYHKMADRRDAHLKDVFSALTPNQLTKEDWELLAEEYECGDGVQWAVNYARANKLSTEDGDGIIDWSERDHE